MKALNAVEEIETLISIIGDILYQDKEYGFLLEPHKKYLTSLKRKQKNRSR